MSEGCWKDEVYLRGQPGLAAVQGRQFRCRENVMPSFWLHDPILREPTLRVIG